MMPRLVKKEMLLKMSALKLFFSLIITLEMAVHGSKAISSGRPPILKTVPASNFTCAGRPAGYYADVAAGCQAYHMCGMNSRKYSYLCPSYTLFHQKYMVCDHYRHVDCSIAEQYYHLNLKIGIVPNKSSKEKKIKAKTPVAPVEASKKPSKEHKTIKLTRTSQHKIEKSVPEVDSRLFSPPKTFGVPGRDKVAPIKKSEIVRPKAPKESLKTRILFQKPRKQVATPNSLSSRRLPKRRGRGSSGRRFLFGGTPKESRDSTDIDGVKFHPIVVRPIRTLFEEAGFTIPPDILRTTTTPLPPLKEEGEQEENLNAAPLLEGDFPAIPTFLIPPLPSLPGNSIAPPKISTFLLPPPPDAPIVIGGPNQEKRTPLVFSNRGRFRSPNRPFNIQDRRRGHRETFFSSPSIRGNADFFIPSPGLLPPLVGNTLEQVSRNDNVDHHHRHRMTMTFPNGKHSVRLAPLALNPNCPQCHPAFLRKNQCTPCVIIR